MHRGLQNANSHGGEVRVHPASLPIVAAFEAIDIASVFSR
jgi:hypothetical protein